MNDIRPTQSDIRLHRVVEQIQSCGAGRGSIYERQCIIMIYELKFPVDLLSVLWNV